MDEASSKENSVDQFQELCSQLVKRYTEEAREKRNAKTREVLAMVGKGLLFAGMIFAPKLSYAYKFHDENNPSWRELEKYSKYYNLTSLKRTLKRLEKQRMVVVKETPDEQVVELTEKGKTRVIKYAIGDFDIKKPDKWDGKWRIVIYDVSEKSKDIRDILRNTLKRLGFLKLQGSVYILPFPCEKEIRFLRAFYGLDSDVTMLVTSKIENDEAYRQYFAI